VRTPWEALHQSLVRSIGTLDSQARYEEMRRRERALRRFADAGALLAYLHDAGGDRDEKDGIYAVLIEATRARGPDVEVALALVWLGLWPGLDAIYRRRLRDYKKPAELVSEIGARFIVLVRDADLGRIHRVAATLVLNVERDVFEALKRRWADEARRADLPHEDKDSDEDDDDTGDRRAACTSPLLRTRGVSELGLPPRLDPEDDVETLRDLLIGIVGGDADIVLGATVYGLSQREVAERLGLSHEVTRKRYQRAIDRIRRHFGVG
jgi:DNA-directed RNA polymerase specialized sigma24 family protein